MLIFGAQAGYGRPRRHSVNRYERPAVVVKLVQILAYAVARAVLVGPPGQALVDQRAAVAVALREPGDPEDLGSKLVDPVALVGGADVRDAVCEAVVGQLGADVPLADAG